MVDTTKSEVLAPQVSVALRMDNLDSSVAISYHQIVSAIKLRENYASRLSKLPSGVFRCILEYQIPTVLLLYRYSDPYVPMIGHQERHFPARKNKLDYNNYLVAIS